MNEITRFVGSINKARSPLFVGLCCGIASVLPDADHLIYYTTGWTLPYPFKGRLFHLPILILAVYMVIYYGSRARRHLCK